MEKEMRNPLVVVCEFKGKYNPESRHFQKLKAIVSCIGFVEEFQLLAISCEKIGNINAGVRDSDFYIREGEMSATARELERDFDEKLSKEALVIKLEGETK